MSASPLDSLLEQFTNGGWAFIESLPEQKREESLHLDFKEKKDARSGDLHGEDRNNLSVALSGFANAEGGLLVWGVSARRGEDDVDRVQRVILIKQLARFRSELETVTPDMVSPQVPGVEHLPIARASDRDEGVVVTVIPGSDLAPHMATGKDLHCYYRRTSSRFQVLEHYEVADLFGRRPQPNIAVTAFWELVRTGEGFQFIVQFMVENRGRGIARFACLTIGHPPEGWPLLNATDQSSVGGPFKKTNAPHGWLLRYRGGADDVLHPGDRFNVAGAGFKIGPDEMRPTFKMEYELVAEGCPAIHGAVEEQFVYLGLVMQNLSIGQRLRSDNHPDNKPHEPLEQSHPRL